MCIYKYTYMCTYDISLYTLHTYIQIYPNHIYMYVYIHVYIYVYVIPLYTLYIHTYKHIQITYTLILQAVLIAPFFCFGVQFVPRNLLHIPNSRKIFNVRMKVIFRKRSLLSLLRILRQESTTVFPAM